MTHGRVKGHALIYKRDLLNQVFAPTPIRNIDAPEENRGEAEHSSATVVPVDSPEGEEEGRGLILQKPSCLFLVARTCGEVPNQEIVPVQIFHGGADAVRETIAMMWPRHSASSRPERDLRQKAGRSARRPATLGFCEAVHAVANLVAEACSHLACKPFAFSHWEPLCGHASATR
jgi:hypothetical protein